MGSTQKATWAINLSSNTANAPIKSTDATVPPESFPKSKKLNPRDRNTLVFMFAILATAPTLGSWSLTVGLAVAFGWVLLAFLFGRCALRLDRATIMAAGATGLYAMVKVAFTVAHSGWDGVHLLYGFVLFLAPVFLISSLRNLERSSILNVAIYGCGSSILLALPVVAYQVFWIGVRAEAGSGNPGVFAVLALIMGSIGGINIVASARSRFSFGYISWLSMVLCVLFSGMRGIWIAIPVVTAVILWAGAQRLSGVAIRRILLAAAASVAIGAGLTGSMIWDRSAQLSADITQIMEKGDYDSSTGRRLLMYEAAWSAILEAPWSGYGIYERMNAVKAHVPADRRDLVAYSHPHNGFLAALLDAGITGLVALCLLLAAPVVIAATADRDEIWRIRMAVALILTTGYVASGMTNILFEHDLMDSAFIVLLVLIAASVPTVDGLGAQRHLSGVKTGDGGA